MVTINGEVPLPKLTPKQAVEVAELVSLMTDPADSVEVRYGRVIWWLLQEVKRRKP